MSDTVIKTKKKKYKFSEDANDVLNKLNLNGKNKKNSKKTDSAPKVEQPSSPRRAQKSSEKPLQTNNSKPLPKKTIVSDSNPINPINNGSGSKSGGSLKTINIDPNYSLDGKGRKTSGKKLKEIESFLNNKTTTYQTPRDDDDIPDPIGTIQDIMRKEKDKGLKNMHNNISSVSVKDINNILFKNRSPQRERQYDEVARRITMKKQEIEHKKTLTNKQQYQHMINEIRKRELENAKLLQKLNTMKQQEQPTNIGKSNSVLILERKRQELINQQRKEVEKILKKKEDIHKIANRKKEIELIRSIEDEKRKLIKLKLEEEKLSKLQYHRELNELKPLNQEKIKSNVPEKKVVTLPKIKPNLDNIDRVIINKHNLDNIDRVIIDKSTSKNKTKKRVRFNLDDNQNYVYIKDTVVNYSVNPTETEGKKKVADIITSNPLIKENKSVKKSKSVKKLKCSKDKSTSNLFNDSLEVQSEYIYYCGLNIFKYDNYKDDYDDIKKISDKDMKRAIMYDYKFKNLDDLTQFDNDNNIASKKKINIIPILYNILTNMNITLYKKRKF